VTTSNEASGSGLRAIALAADRLEAGRADVAIGGGFDSMILDSLWVVNLDVHMGEITERLVDREGDRFDLSRATQDRYAHESHRWAADAIDDGPFDEEIVPVETPEGSVERDEGPRPESTVEDLGALPTAFREDRTITAGNASKLSDGETATESTSSNWTDTGIIADHPPPRVARRLTRVTPTKRYLRRQEAAAPRLRHPGWRPRYRNRVALYGRNRTGTHERPRGRRPSGR
jgi:acetyl-CoA acetyltransferase